MNVSEKQLLWLDFQCFQREISTSEADLLRSGLPITLREIVWPHCSSRNPQIVTVY